MLTAPHAADLVAWVLELSSSRSIDEIMAVVKRGARRLTGADGVTFVLREGDCCYYADEDAVGPLWKGKRFPLKSCISGWVMLHRERVAIEDIYADERIPADAYRPTFVKSLAMVPIRAADPLGAIGAYWAAPHRATAAELDALQALADSAAVAVANLELIHALRLSKEHLERRVEERTADLDAFSASVAHDLRAPLRAMKGFADILRNDYAGRPLDAPGTSLLERIVLAAERMDGLIDGLLAYARLSREDIPLQGVGLRSLLEEILQEAGAELAARRAAVEVPRELPAVRAHRLALRQALTNLLSNAVKFVSPGVDPRVAVTAERRDGRVLLTLADNGIGIAPELQDRLFKPFSRLHGPGGAYPGAGMGLAIVRKAVERMGGRAGVASEPGRGSRFWIELPEA